MLLIKSVVSSKPELDTELGFSPHFDPTGELDTLPSALILWKDLKEANTTMPRVPI